MLLPNGASRLPRISGSSARCLARSPTTAGSKVQLPPAFGPAGFDVLAAFLRRLPSDWTWVLELRHAGWFDGSPEHRQLDEQLLDRNIGRVVLDTRPLYAVPAASPPAVEERGNKPRLPITLDAIGQHPVIRVIGEDRPEGTLAGLRAWVPQIVEWVGEGREPYLFVHQPENLDSPGLARQIHEIIRDELPNVAPLPDPLPPDPPTQPALFS